MSRVIKALLISAAATGAAALILRQLDLENAPRSAPDAFPGMEAEDMPEEDLNLLMRELASQLGV